MSHHRYPICPTSGKVRYGSRKDVKLEMRQASRDRSRARMNEVTCSRREVRSYECSDCSGWHLTSQPDRPARLVPVTKVTAWIPGPAAEAIRRMVAATGVRAATPA
ncbi:MAG TPA: hypothetical protein VIJ15_13850 [Dermatophilaceae bacterium]